MRHLAVAKIARTWAIWLACPPSGEGQPSVVTVRVKSIDDTFLSARAVIKSVTATLCPGHGNRVTFPAIHPRPPPGTHAAAGEQ